MLRVLLIALCLLQASPGAHDIPVSVIVVPTDADARAVIDRLKAGTDFAALAREKSIDPSAPDGGYLGMTDPAQLRAELRNALAGLNAGEVSGIARIPSGFAVLKVGAAPAAPPAAAGPVARQAISGAGAVRLTWDYAGFGSALAALNRYPKPDGWNSDQRSACQVRTEAIPATIAQIEPLRSRTNFDPAFLRDVNGLAADLQSYSGNYGEAIRAQEDAERIALQVSPDRVPQIEEAIGVLHLQRAGQTLYQRFIFPNPLPKLAAGAAEKRDLTAAGQYFIRYLGHVPDDGEVRWLLNLTFMLSGEYPSGVPAKYLIPPSAFTSKNPAPRFHDVAAAAGLARTGQAGGLIVDDFDNDGLPDVMMSSVNDCEPIAFFHNNGDGTFTNRTDAAGLAAQTGGLNIVQTDYNNDGCLDILILRGGWEYPRRKSLLRNNCDGTFRDVTEESGIAKEATATQTAVWVNIDNDGFLDLFVGNENAPAQLFRNNGDGTFTDIAQAAGVASREFIKGVVAADYNNDGLPDLYTSALNGEHHLYRNNGNLTFTDVTKEAGLEGPWTTFGALFFDFDNDGWEDLLVAGYGTSVEEVMKGYTGGTQSGETLHLFRNLGNGKFEDVSARMGLRKVLMPMGLNAGDYDNDGFPDIYLGSGNPSYASPVPNVLFHNDAGKRFLDVTVASGTGVLPKGHGIAFADLDNDGDEDLVVVMGGAVPGDRQSARVFENSQQGANWLNVRLVGVKSNRAAIGARIKLTVRSNDGTRHLVQRTVSSGGSFGAGPLEQHLGLGRDGVPEQIEILWPASRTRQTFTKLGKNQSIEIHEGASETRVIARTAFHLGAPARH